MMTKMMREVEEEEYEQRMKKTKLMSLEMRRLRSDLIEVYKVMHNFKGLKREDFFPERSAARRGHHYRVKLSILDPLSRKWHSTVIENTVKIQFLLITCYCTRYIIYYVLHRNARNFIIFHDK